MELEDIVTSLELSQELAELGAEQNSLFYWIKGPDLKSPWLIKINDIVSINDGISAFTASELFELLPAILSLENGTYFLKQDFYIDGTVNIYYSVGSYAPIDFTDKKEADARAKMLIYLIENELM